VLSVDDELPAALLGEDGEPAVEPEELGLLLLGELDIEPEPDEDEPDEDGVEDEPEPDDSGLLERLVPEAPVVELAPRSQP
jgi:hypothetical protein